MFKEMFINEAGKNESMTMDVFPLMKEKEEEIANHLNAYTPCIKTRCVCVCVCMHTYAHIYTVYIHVLVLIYIYISDVQAHAKS